MAFQARGRDPLLDSKMAEAIEKRGKELAGLLLLALGVMAAAMIASYHPDDPSWISATDAPVRNWMGSIGASIAAPLFMIIGWGAWGLAIVLAAWGIRFTLHSGEDRAISRLIFAPIWIAVLALFASSLTPGDIWAATHRFGLGGLFGDTVLGVILGLLPLSAGLSLNLMSVLLGISMLGLGAFVLGFTMVEMKRLFRFHVVGIIMTYAALMTLLNRGAGKAANAAQTMRTRNVERRLQREQEDDDLIEADTGIQASHIDTPGGLLSRLPSLIRRPETLPEPELVEPTPQMNAAQAPGEDHLRERITNVIKSRLRQTPATQVETDTPLTRGRGRGPDPLILNIRPPVELPAEPPLTMAMPYEAETLIAPEEPSLPDISDFQDVPAEAPAFAQPRISIPMEEPRKVVQHMPRKTQQPSSQAKAEAQPALQFDDTPAIKYELPPLSLLSTPVVVQHQHLSDDALEENAKMLENVLDDYGVKGDIVSVRPGPVVTMYELEPAPGLKASRVIGLADDIARSMSALSARVSTVPGRSVIGIELPNEKREMVALRELLSTREFGDGNQKLPLALGKDIGGDPVISNLAKMPHLLIAGTTGSGKSVAINTMILSLLYKLTPNDCRMIMIDPKMLELSVYDGIPHLLSPVVTDPKKAVVALKWVVAEMEDRYRKMSKMGVRNIDGYNGRVKEAQSKNEMFSRTVQTGFDDDTGEPVFETDEFAPEKMPYIVVIVDEMADLMMVAGKEIEACIQRLAQMARASGIHLIMATQRPSVDVITGTIKANFPTRISFQVTSKIDSRTILGEMGAEQLLGMGDMLFMAGGGKITRCHGPFVSDEEVEEVVNNLKAYGPPEYVGSVLEGPDEDKASNIDAVLGLNTGGNTDGENALYDTAVQIAITDRKCSTSYIQRKLAIGYNKAARLVEQMEDEGIVSAANHVGKREILVPERN